jgi:histone acetyltransferase (RNA polymerase elongator complex component)
MEKMYKRGEYTPYSLEEAVEISTELLKLYKDAKVKVIRIGLQPTESITWGQDIIDGPFHPAFRELAEGNLICNNLKSKAPDDKDIIIEINPKDVSKLYANKKEYFKRFISSRSGKVFVNVENKVKGNKIKLTIIDKRDEFKI